MNEKEQIKRIEKAIKPYKITDGKDFRLKDIKPDDTLWFKSEQKDEAKELLEQGVVWLSELQDRLYAQDRWGVLCIFQAMDAAGKDGTIKHVMSGVNPQGVQVYSFKQPSAEELNHDYMWRYVKDMPDRGCIGIFNRSYYEEVLVVRVHKEILAKQKLPAEVIGKHIWRDRLKDIANFEEYLHHNGIVVLKFFLHLSKKEQKTRFLARLDDPDKNWKFSSADAIERGFFDDYMAAYEDAIRHTATPHAPWYVVPADNKWFTRLVVAAAIVERLHKLNPHYPSLGKTQLEELKKAKRILLGADDKS
ncbi:MAG TPA: polyphosphate kinase 2 family protein [Candidatus Obscuribacterales bacterium]